MTYICYNTGVAKLLDSQSHFSKFEIVRDPQLNTYLKGIQKRYSNIRIFFYKNYINIEYIY